MRPFFLNTAILQENDPITLLEEVHAVSHQHHCLPPQQHLGSRLEDSGLEAHLNVLVEDMLADLGVYSRQGIVQEVDVHVGVESSRQVHPLPLATR